MIACARAVTLAGLTPVFVDCRDDLLLDPDLLNENLVTNHPHLRAIMPVHVYGRGCDMLRITRFAHQHNLQIIEDCAEYHGGFRSLEFRADVSCWSFYQNKIIAGEEGGAISFLDEQLADRARCLRGLGFNAEHNFIHEPRAINARLSNANALLILKSLSHVEENLAKRKQVERWYDAYIPEEWQTPPRNVCWVYVICLPREIASGAVHLLRKRGVEARHGFKPMSMQHEYLGPYKGLNAYRLSQEVLYLPIHPTMTERDVWQTSQAVCEVVQQAND
jgi:dTDP-4-amino-4,6-dideoxygalactose transaminase